MEQINRKERIAQDLTLTVGYVMFPLAFRVIPDSELLCRKTRKRDSKEGSALLFFLPLNSVLALLYTYISAPTRFLWCIHICTYVLNVYMSLERNRRVVMDFRAVTFARHLSSLVSHRNLHLLFHYPLSRNARPSEFKSIFYYKR